MSLCGKTIFNSLASRGAPPGAKISTEAAPNPSLSEGNSVGKRYIDDTGAQVLVTKSGTGTLSIETIPVAVTAAKPLPAGD